MALLLGHLACTNALHHHMTAALADGEKKPKFRKVRDDDKFIICRSLNVELPAFTAADGTEIDGIQCRMLWDLKAKDLHVELSEENLRYCFAALANSEPIEKKSKKPRDEDGAEPAQCSSPRKRRRLKRRLSEQGERAASADKVEEEPKSWPLHDRAKWKIGRFELSCMSCRFTFSAAIWRSLKSTWNNTWKFYKSVHVSFASVTGTGDSKSDPSKSIEWRLKCKAYAEISLVVLHLLAQRFEQKVQNRAVVTICDAPSNQWQGRRRWFTSSSRHSHLTAACRAWDGSSHCGSASTRKCFSLRMCTWLSSQLAEVERSSTATRTGWSMRAKRASSTGISMKNTQRWQCWSTTTSRSWWWSGRWCGARTRNSWPWSTAIARLGRPSPRRSTSGTWLSCTYEVV